MNLSLENLLEQIDETKYLTLESTIAIDSMGYDIVSRLQDKLSLEEKNKIFQKTQSGIKLEIEKSAVIW